MPSIEPVEVFISYHQKDESLYEELKKHLKTLQREKAITSFSHRELVAGTEVKAEIDKRLDRAGIILLLISSDFVDSDYHWSNEVTRALERKAAGKASVFPVLLRNTDWQTSRTKDLLTLPKNGHPVKSTYWNDDRDAAFLEIARGIREEVAKLTASPNFSAPSQDTAVQERLTLKPAQEQSQFDRTGSNDLILELALSSDEFTYGVKKQIALQDGAVTVTVPPGLSPGKKLKLQGKGNLNSLTQKRGDLYLKLSVSNFSSSSQQTLKELEERQYKVTSLISEADRLIESAKFKEAELKYKAALNLDPNSLYAINSLTVVLYFQDKLEEAVGFTRRAISLDPKNVTAYIQLGDALAKQGKFEEAIISYRQAIRLNPNFFAYYKLGNALEEQGKQEEAMSAYRQSIQMCPDYPETYNSLGAVLWSQGRQEEAIAAHRQAIHLDPTNYRSYMLLGISLAQQGKQEEAISAYVQALEINPKFVPGYHFLGGLLHDQGKLEEAIGVYFDALEIDPDHEEVNNLLSRALSEQEQYELSLNLFNQSKWKEADTEFRKVIQMLPDFAEAHFLLASSLSKQGNLDEAITEYRKAIQINSANPYFYNNLGVSLLTQGQTDEAIDAFRKAIQIDPNESTFIDNLEYALKPQGQKKKFLGLF